MTLPAAIPLADTALARAARRWLGVLALALWAAAAPCSAADPASQPPLGPGLHTLQVSHDGLVRKVLVRVPATPHKPLPLVLAFHGGGGHAEFMADDARYGLGREAERSGFVVAFPNGYSRWPGGRLATWHAGGCCGEARDRGIDDVGFARAVVAAVQARVAIDAGRVFATGMSNGGMLAHRLACEASDVFAAVASVAGTDALQRCEPTRPVSVLHLHARDDTHVLYGGGAGPGAFRDTRQVMDFVSVPETMRRWVARNRCEARPQTTLQRPGAQCETYTGCAGGVSVALCTTERGGHSWPGADRVRMGKPDASQALEANEVIWDFFRSAPRR